VAIEGPCCAGKTTLAEAILDRLDDRTTTIIPDYADFVGGGAGMPQADPASWPDELAAVHELLCVEEDRLRDCPPDPTPRLVLIDRSILTLIAHCAGTDRRHARVSGFAEPVAALVRADHRPRWPQGVLYLDVPREVQLARNRGKFASDSVFINAAFNEGFRAYFAARRDEGAMPMAWIAGDLPVATVLGKALAFLSGPMGVRGVGS
jgi:thymidylate kinase